MALRSRRQYLAGLAGTGAVALSGCVASDDDRPAFLVTDTAFRILEPDDIEVQVTIENGSNERRQSPLEVVVRYEPEDGEAQEWVQTATIEMASGTEMQRLFRFEDVYEGSRDVEMYEIEAQLLDGDRANE